MSEQAPPRISGLPFEYFHPLDGHWPFTAACRALPPHGAAAGRRHLYLAWHYRRKWQLRRVTLCRIGVHQMGTVTLCRIDVHQGTVWRCELGSDSDPGTRWECLRCAHPHVRTPVIYPRGPVSRAVRRAGNMLSGYER